MLSAYAENGTDDAGCKPGPGRDDGWHSPIGRRFRGRDAWRGRRPHGCEIGHLNHERRAEIVGGHLLSPRLTPGRCRLDDALTRVQRNGQTVIIFDELAVDANDERRGAVR